MTLALMETPKMKKKLNFNEGIKKNQDFGFWPTFAIKYLLLLADIINVEWGIHLIANVGQKLKSLVLFWFPC